MIYAAIASLIVALGNSVYAQELSLAPIPPIIDLPKPVPTIDYNEPTYAVYVPKTIRIGIPFSIDVEVLPDYKGSVDVKATLTPSQRNNAPKLDFSSTSIATIASGETKTIEFTPIPYGHVGVRYFQVRVIGRNSTSNEVAFNVTTSNIQYQSKFVSIFIQTDKAIYQPGQTIKFRAVVTTPALLPYDGLVNFKLQDPRGNIIMRERNAALTKGVLGAEFKLGRYATQGNWRITYEVHSYQKSITVSVEEYKLPKFSVDIKTDQAFLHPGSTVLSGEVKATYTFGQPVKGSGYIEASIRTFRRFPLPLSNPKIRIEFTEFSGTGRFEITAKDVADVLKWNPKYYSQPITLFASIKEKNTGETFNKTTTIRLERVRIKVEALAKPDHIKPGLPYTAYLKVSQQDGSDLSAEELGLMRVEMQIRYSFRYNHLLTEQRRDIERRQNLTIGEGGLMIFNLATLTGDWDNVHFTVKIPTYPDPNEYWTGWSVDRFESPSNTFLQVTTSDSSLTVGDMAVVTVATTQIPESSMYRISVIARGRVVKNEMYTPSSYETTGSIQSFEYKFTVLSNYAPSLYVLVSFVRGDGEFIADTVKINVQAKLDNEVTMTSNTQKTDAGMPVSITVSADPGSYVGLRAIDQSVLLLKSGNDITRSKVFADLDEYGIAGGFYGGFLPRGGWWWPWPVGGGDVSEVFDNSGFIILTDGLVYKTPPDYDYNCFRCPVAFGVRAFSGGATRRRTLSRPANPPPVARYAPKVTRNDAESKTRSFFPESWIWSEHSLSDDGSITFNYTTPDTITTWELSSFAMSNNKGLGVTAQNSKITVFRSFFISLNLPPSIVRGEILNMKTTLFNYFDIDVTATLTLEENEWYDLVIPPGASLEIAGGTRVVTIPSKDSVTITFPIKFKKVGQSKISVRAKTPVAGDAVERTLLVKPEGVPKIVSHSRIIDRPTDFEPATSFSFDVDIPADAVEGSVHVKCAVSGNILGSSLSNIGNLLRMPSGCGEQTMLNFAPSVFVSKYLKETGELTGQFKQKSENFIRGGYQNELRYQRRDGSFSAFGSSDASGSTWLTAFVVKCFIAANDLNPDLIEESKIRQAVSFLLKQQRKDGTFTEPGRVIHESMQGGVDSNETTAAYMLIALKEGNMYGRNNKDEDVEAAMKKTVTYLESKIDFIDDLYTLSIVGYALALMQSEKAGAVLARIDAKATVENNLKFWKNEQTGAAKCDENERYCPFESDQPASSAIESTSYILLMYVKLGRINDVMPIVRWLVQQRGAFGGYHSTQDTVMAIQALATVAGHFSGRKLDMTVNVAHDGKADFGASFKLSDDNAIVLQMVELPSKDGTVTITASGTGVGDVQLTVGYNLPVGPRADEPFVVDVTSQETPDHKVRLKICSRINEDRTEVVNGTGMYVVTFALPSGYTIDQEQATKDNPSAKLVELEGEEVTGYFDELTKGKTLCLDLILIQFAAVAGVKPKLVIAYDYYKPQMKAMRPLALKSDEDVCKVCGTACAGCTEDYDRTGCGSLTFPCPDFYDGLFYDSGSEVMSLLASRGGSVSCSAPEGAGDSSKVGGPPASLLNGVNQYIECKNSASLKRILSKSKGFTISIAIRPEVANVARPHVVYTITSKTGKPHVIFNKRRRSRHYWYKVLLDGIQMTTIGIRMEQIPLNSWSLVTAVVRNKSVDVYLNGQSVGQTVRWKATSYKVMDDVTMKIGRSHIGNAYSRGDFDGLVSSLDMWASALTQKQVQAHYLHYQRILDEVNPMLSMKQARRFVPEPIKQCFDAPTYLSSQLKSRAGVVEHSCSDDKE